MKILLVGSGGREHALAWKIVRSPLVTRLVCAPGNPGMAGLGDTRAVAATDIAGQVALAREIGAALVVIGPEAAVEAGLADALAEAGIACFGPTAAAGRLESSKAFTKAFADRHGLPTARYGVFDAAAPAKAGERQRASRSSRSRISTALPSLNSVAPAMAGMPARTGCSSLMKTSRLSGKPSIARAISRPPSLTRTADSVAA